MWIKLHLLRNILRQWPTRIWTLVSISIESIDLIDNLVGNLPKQHDSEKKQAYSNALVDVGCYVGGVIIRNFGGSWQEGTNENDFPLGIIMAGSNTNLYSNPIGKVFKRYEEGKKHDLKTFVVSQTMLNSSFGLGIENQ